MRPHPCLAVWLALATGLSLAAPSAHAQSDDLRFSNPARFMSQTGEALYADICQGCHMRAGEGAAGAGAYPALAKNPKLASAAYSLALVINGYKDMPPFGALLTDQQVAAVVGYVRTHFGNAYADEVTAADAKAARR
jgi:mono/diheme cytochrome c family protein